MRHFLRTAVLIASLVGTGFILGVLWESIRAFPYDKTALGAAKRRLHAAKEWKAAGEILAITIGGATAILWNVAYSVLVFLGLLAFAFFAGHWFIHGAEWDIRRLKDEVRDGHPKS